MRRWIAAALAAVTLLAAGWYLYDPPWIANVTSGMRGWEEDSTGTRLRWTAGHASFFVPGSAREMTLPMRALFPLTDGRPVIVRMSVDDRWLADVEIRNPSEWALPTVPLPRQKTRRRFRRVELRVSRVVGFYNLGVQVGEPRFR